MLSEVVGDVPRAEHRIREPPRLADSLVASR
jgi:hypothetical protein